MSTSCLNRLALLFMALISLIAADGRQQPSLPATTGAGNDLVVHEWGTFTSVAGRDGAPLSWRPLSFESDLPEFVYSIDDGASWEGALRYPTKSARAVTVRMETPLLYFYTKAETNVSVKVNFTGGTITEWYPQRARTGGTGIDWGQVQVLPNVRVELPREPGENHYYPARETDAAVVRVRSEEKTEYEKFLFYRGVGDFQLPLSVLISGDKVLVKNASAGGAGTVILFERRGGKSGYVVGDAPRGETRLARPALAPDTAPPRRELKSLLTSHGLYEKEAEAMLNTWRDSWFEEGLRVFYVLPRQSVDAILPLAINPQPKELVRVLVGRAELITPEMERDVTEQLAKLDDSSAGVREAAMKEINKYGRFANTILGQVAAHAYETDPQTVLRVQRLMRGMGRRPRPRIE